MAIVFGQLNSGPNTIFGQLDQSLTVAHEHTGQDVLTLVDNGTHQQDVVWDHGLGGSFDVYAAGTHEHVLQPSAPSYLHDGASLLTLFDAGLHEHIPTVVVHTHSGIDLLALSDAGTHTHFPGAAGDFIHSAESRVTLSATGTHSFTPSQFVIVDQEQFTELTRWKAQTPDEAQFDFSALGGEMERIKFRIASDDPNWIANSGPSGGQIAAVVELVNANGTVQPVVSLSANYPEATIFDYEDQSELFDALSDAVVGGPFSLRVGGYEALPDRTLPIDFSGVSTLSVEALV